jgi:hypothetical protein
MTQGYQAKLGYRQVCRTIRRATKQVLVANALQPATKRGNKELSIAINHLALQAYDNLEAATEAGQVLGQQIVDLSKAKGKTNLDSGIVRQLLLSGAIPTVTKPKAKLAKATPVVVIPAKSSTLSAVTVPETPAPGLTEPEPTVFDKPNTVGIADSEPVATVTPEAIAGEVEATEPFTIAGIETDDTPDDAGESVDAELDEGDTVVAIEVDDADENTAKNGVDDVPDDSFASGEALEATATEIEADEDDAFSAKHSEADDAPDADASATTEDDLNIGYSDDVSALAEDEALAEATSLDPQPVAEVP